MPDDIRYLNATIVVATSTTVSSAVTIPDGCVLVGVYPDAAWDTQTLSFQVSWDDVTYAPLYDEATAYAFAGAVKQIYYAVNQNLFWGVRRIKIVSGVAQGDDTVITCVFVKVS